MGRDAVFAGQLRCADKRHYFLFAKLSLHQRLHIRLVSARPCSHRVNRHSEGCLLATCADGVAEIFWAGERLCPLRSTHCVEPIPGRAWTLHEGRSRPRRMCHARRHVLFHNASISAGPGRAALANSIVTRRFFFGVWRKKNSMCNIYPIYSPQRDISGERIGVRSGP